MDMQMAAVFMGYLLIFSVFVENVWGVGLDEYIYLFF